MKNIVSKVHDAVLIAVSAALITEATYQVALTRSRAAKQAEQNTVRRENSTIVEDPRNTIRELRRGYRL